MFVKNPNSFLFLLLYFLGTYWMEGYVFHESFIIAKWCTLHITGNANQSWQLFETPSIICDIKLKAIIFLSIKCLSTIQSESLAAALFKPETRETPTIVGVSKKLCE